MVSSSAERVAILVKYGQNDHIEDEVEMGEAFDTTEDADRV
jgi:hypothetical protein